MLVITEQNETPQQPLFHHTLCCIKFSDINFDSWVRVKLFFLTSHHCSKHCHTQCISRAVLILSWICPLSLSSAIWLQWYTKHRAGVLHRGCWTTTAARKCNLQSSHPGPPHCRLLSDHAQLSCTSLLLFLMDFPNLSPSCCCRDLSEHILPLLCLWFNSYATENGLKWAVPHLTELKPALWCDRDGNHIGHIK